MSTALEKRAAPSKKERSIAVGARKKIDFAVGEPKENERNPRQRIEVGHLKDRAQGQYRSMMKQTERSLAVLLKVFNSQCCQRERDGVILCARERARLKGGPFCLEAADPCRGSPKPEIVALDRLMQGQRFDLWHSQLDCAKIVLQMLWRNVSPSSNLVMNPLNLSIKLS